MLGEGDVERVGIGSGESAEGSVASCAGGGCDGSAVGDEGRGTRSEDGVGGGGIAMGGPAGEGGSAANVRRHEGRLDEVDADCGRLLKACDGRSMVE